MTVSRTCAWVGWWLALGCAPGTKSGGMIVDDSGTDTDATATSGVETTATESEDDTSSGDTDSAPACEMAPACGDGIIGALEECDGVVDCSACASTSEETVLVDGGGIDLAHILPDGSAVGVVLSEKGAIPLVRRWDATGDMQWSVAVDDDVSVRDLTVDDDGIIYVAGGRQLEPDAPGSEPLLWSIDGDGNLGWEVSSGDAGWHTAVATSDGRILAAGGSNLQRAGSVGTLTMYEGQVQLLWDVEDTEVSWIDDATFVGDDIAATAAIPTTLASDSSAALVRYDADGTRLWAATLPDDGEPDDKSWYVIGDGGSGTWTLGRADRTPYVVHHDAEGNVLEEIACIGGATGGVQSAAIDGDGALALAITFDLHVDEIFENHAWFPVLVGGQVVSSTSFSSDTQTAATFAIAWRDDGARVLGWTNFGSEGGPGRSQLVLVP
jgi:hypothetical protein